VVLSRRPGRIRRIVPVEIPQRERAAAVAASALSGLREELWSLIRDEAAIADREMVHA
jgi:NitT/TauT family transport system ATP-binding protein